MSNVACDWSTSWFYIADAAKVPNSAFLMCKYIRMGITRDIQNFDFGRYDVNMNANFFYSSADASP